MNFQRELQRFKTLKIHLRATGCLAFQDLPYLCQKSSLQNFLFLIITIVLVLNVFSIWHYFLFEASNFAEYVETTFGGIIGTLTLSQHCLSIWNRNRISYLFNKIDQITAQRKTNFRKTYIDFNEISEKRTKLIYKFVFKYIFPCFIFPKPLNSYYNYFTTHDPEKSFQLIYPTT